MLEDKGGIPFGEVEICDMFDRGREQTTCKLVLLLATNLGSEIALLCRG